MSIFSRKNYDNEDVPKTKIGNYRLFEDQVRINSSECYPDSGPRSNRLGCSSSIYANLTDRTEIESNLNNLDIPLSNNMPTVEEMKNNLNTFKYLSKSTCSDGTDCNGMINNEEINTRLNNINKRDNEDEEIKYRELLFNNTIPMNSNLNWIEDEKTKMECNSSLDIRMGCSSRNEAKDNYANKLN